MLKAFRLQRRLTLECASTSRVQSLSRRTRRVGISCPTYRSCKDNDGHQGMRNDCPKYSFLKYFYKIISYMIIKRWLLNNHQAQNIKDLQRSSYF